MVIALLIAQGADLGTFLAIMPLVGPSVELLPIGSVYAALGTLGAISFKASLGALILSTAAMQRRARIGQALVVAGIVGGVIGLASNTIAMWQIATALTLR